MGECAAYAPSAPALSRLARIMLVSIGLGALLFIAQANREALEAALGPKEIVVALLIVGGGLGYFLFLFLSGAVTLGEVRAALRRERAAAGSEAGLPPSLDG